TRWDLPPTMWSVPSRQFTSSNPSAATSPARSPRSTRQRAIAKLRRPSMLRRSNAARKRATSSAVRYTGNEANLHWPPPEPRLQGVVANLRRLVHESESSCVMTTLAARRSGRVAPAILSEEIDNVAGFEAANVNRAISETVEQEFTDPHSARDSGGWGQAAYRIQMHLELLKLIVNRWRFEPQTSNAVPSSHNAQQMGQSRPHGDFGALARSWALAAPQMLRREPFYDN